MLAAEAGVSADPSAPGTRVGGVGGWTPADLPLIVATQADIERWQDRHPGLVDVLPLSPLQEGLFFHARFDADGVDFYAVQLVIDLRGALDVTRLRTAARELLDLHPALRTVFVDDGTEPVQVVLGDVEPAFTVLDLTAQTPTAQTPTAQGSTTQAPTAESEAGAATALEEFLAADRTTRFDLDVQPPLRFTLVRLGAHEHRLVVTTHHLVLDGWSTPLVIRDLLALYQASGNADAALTRPRPYRDFLAWLAGQDRAESRAAWAEILQGVDQPTLLAGPDARETGVIPDAVLDVVPAAVTAQLTGTARQRGVTVNTLLSAAWGLVLGRLTGSDDVVFGVTVSGRPPEIAGVESMVGLFINTIPVRVRWSPGETADILLGRLHEAQIAVLDHQYLGLTEIQGAAGIGGGRLFDTLMVFETFPLETTDLLDPARSGGLTAEVGLPRGYTHYPLTLLLMPDQDELRIKLEYRPDLFSEQAARTILRRFLDVLDRLASQPELSLSRLDVLSADERRELVAEWSGAEVSGAATPSGSDGFSSVLGVWDGVVAAGGGEVAVVCGGV
ncbi:condensation domain-containing protein, partial [Frankia sp. AiPs1]